MRQALCAIAHVDEIGIRQHARQLRRAVRQLQLELDAHQPRRIGDVRGRPEE